VQHRSSDSAPDAQHMRYTRVDEEEDEDKVQYEISSKFSVVVCLQLARKIEALDNRADLLVLAADILRSRIPHWN